MVQHFNEQAVELSAMWRLQDAKLEEHLEQCTECMARVEEHRAWIATLKDGLRHIHLNPIDLIALQPQSYRLRIKL